MGGPKRLKHYTISGDALLQLQAKLEELFPPAKPSAR